MKTRKIILFIVEGITDKNSLSLIISKILKNEKVEFCIVGGDVSSEKETNLQNCISKVNYQVKKFLSNNRFFKKTDILKIVHLVDTDGAFVENNLVKNDNNYKIKYTQDYILTCNVENIIKRNERKSKVLSKLYSLKDIGGIQYNMYYFSCNLEHVLHNIENLNDSLKDDYSYEFADKFYGHEIEFIKFIKESSFSVLGDYNDTWSFIKEGNNSLNRYSNFGLFFDNNTYNEN